MCACNCLDEMRDGKIKDLNSDMYNCISERDLFGQSNLEQNYICTECCPKYLKTIKADKANDSLKWGLVEIRQRKQR